MNTPPQSATGFWSIERFVAFVLGPAVTAGSGWLSLFLAKKFGIHIGGSELTGIFATGGLAAGGLAYKWLHGRQVETQAGALVAQAESLPGVGGFLRTTLHDLEGVAQAAATHAVEAISHAPPSATVPAAAYDPAPAGQVADAGAASGV